MVSFNFNVAIYGFDQWAGAATNNTVSYPVGTTFTLDPNAELTVIEVEDDDGNPVGSSNNFFSDGFIDTPGDGSSPSTGNNDQVLTQPVTINGNSFDVGDQVELEFAFETTTGETFWIIRIDGQNVGISGPVLPTPGSTFEVAGSADGSETPIDAIPCFVAGARIDTPQGAVAVEDLSVGDLVRVKDGPPQPIRWIGHRHLDAIDLAQSPNLRPIRIAAGALGAGRPARDLLVSPQHRILVGSRIVRRMFDAGEVLVPAKALLSLAGVDVVTSAREVHYVHLLFRTHEVLFANDLATESMFLGPEALKSVSAAARREITALFPELLDPRFAPIPAAEIPPRHRQRRLVDRHVRNGVDLAGSDRARP